MKISLRPMMDDDLDQVAGIERRVSPHPWSRPQFADSLPRHQCVVLVADNRICGYLIFSLVADEAELLNIAVDTDYRCRGLGRKLLEHCLRSVAGRAQRLYLEVRASNRAARRLYESSGFGEICMRRNYYQTRQGPEDAVLMAMDLCPEFLD